MADLSRQLDWLYGVQQFGIKLGLESARRLLAALPKPVSWPATFHVAGTNGKGSVCAFLESILRQHGQRTGLFTSPHLIHFRERIQVDRQAIADAALAGHLREIQQLVASWEPHPTFFELALAVAMRHFAAQPLDAVILETGLGGRLDATNAVEPVRVAVITSIGLDHTRHLGETLAEIACEKAGIIKPGVPVISAPQAPEVCAVLERVAAENGARLLVVDRPVDWPVSLAGVHQRWNAALAVAAARAAGLSLEETRLRRALLETEWPGRFQRFGEAGRIVMDGAHNPAAALALANTWQAEFPGEMATLIFGAARDKDVPALLAALLPIACRIIFTPINSPRSTPPAEMPAVATAKENAANFHDALARAQRHPERILIAGSLFLAGEAAAHLRGEAAALRLESQ